MKLSPQFLAAVLAVSALAASALLTQLIRSLAADRGVLDIPNARSSHGMPTPRGGGVAIVGVTTVGVLVLALQGVLSLGLSAALVVGGLAVAIVGLADDRYSLSASLRLAVHFAAALWALAWLGGLPALQLGRHVISLGWVGYILGSLGIVWAINLFNFMDGVDGIAATEAMFVAVAGALLSGPLTTAVPVCLVALTFAAACGGFLLWNWPPARIFMGDVGSGYLGYVIVVLAVATARQNPVTLWTWLILGGAFFVDATVTLARRALRREPLQQAHRSHAYQWLARRWRSHGKVTVAVLLVNCLWLLPWAMLAASYPALASSCVLAALAPLAALAIRAGAGRREIPGSPP